MRTKGRLLLPALAAGVLGVTVLSTATAKADTISMLNQLTNFHQMVVDTTAGYVFISEGQGSDRLLNGVAAAASSGIVVTDLQGNYLTTLDAGDGVEGLALSADGNTLYAALGAQSAVAAIDLTSAITSSTTTPVQALYALGAGDLPYSVAIQSGKLWVSYDQAPFSDGTYAGGLASIGDFPLPAAGATGSPTFETQPNMGHWYSAPDIAGDPSDSGVLAAAQPDSEPASVSVYDVTADPATLTATKTMLTDSAGNTNCWFENGISVLPGGADVSVECGAGNYYNTKDLSYAGSNAGGGSAFAMDPSTGLTAQGNGIQSQPDVYVYASGSSAPVNEFTFSDGETLLRGGLGIASDDSRLYAVTNVPGTSLDVLHVFTNPTVTRSSLALTGTYAAIINTPGTFTGTLTLSNGAALPADAAVTVTRTAPDGTTSPVPSPTVGSDGSFSITDTTTKTGRYTYNVAYAGSASDNTAASSASYTTTSAYNTSWLSLTSSAGTYTYGQSVSVSGKLSFGTGAPAAGTPVTITRGGTSAKTFKVTTASDGSFKLTDAAPAIGSYTYTAAFAGDATTSAATSTKTTVAVARTTPSLNVITSAANYVYGSKITVTASLGSTFADRTVSLYATPYGQAKKLLKTGTVDSSGHLSVTYVLTRNTTFTATFGGDVHNAPVTKTKFIGSMVKVWMGTGGWYTSQLISGTWYHVYHHTAKLNVAVTITPSKPNELAIMLQLQQWDPSTRTWFSNATFGAFWLNKYGTMRTSLSLTQAAGAQYRMRAVYAQPGSDKSDISTNGGWTYFKVVN